MSSSIINAWDNCGWVWELVLLEESVEQLLNNFFVGWIWAICASQNLVAVCSAIKANLVILAGFEVVVQASEPSMDFQIVKSHKFNNFLFQFRAVSLVSDSVLSSQSFKFFVSIKAIFNRLRNLISKTFDQIHQLKQVFDASLRCFRKDFSSKDYDFMGSSIINAWHNSCGIGQFVLFEESIEQLLNDLFIGWIWLAGLQVCLDLVLGVGERESYQEKQGYECLHMQINYYMNKIYTLYQLRQQSTNKIIMGQFNKIWIRIGFKERFLDLWIIILGISILLAIFLYIINGFKSKKKIKKIFAILFNMS